MKFIGLDASLPALNANYGLHFVKERPIEDLNDLLVSPVITSHGSKSVGNFEIAVESYLDQRILIVD